jgi:two-component system phosphate regulon sensor histidine kinase PhoR
MGSRLSTRMRDRIGKIEIETGHLVQMVTELLDLSRIESGSAMPLLDEVDPARLVATSVERLRLFAERAGVTLVAQAEPDLPRITANDDRLGQVLVNLLHNAIKFSPSGGVVTASARRAGAELVELCVADEGIGIPAAAQSRIFERFYKVDRARSSGGGTGLGLSIARHVVEHHGGTIRVESEEGRGAAFIVRLPVRHAATETPPIARAS